MGQTEIILFFITTTFAVLILITGIIIFILKYRKRKIKYNEELRDIEESHKIDLMNTELNMRQQTMQYIGREIHDSVAQKLTLASIYAHKLDLKNDGRDHETISKIIDEALLELRMLSRTLVDNKLQTDDLEELLRTECDRINALEMCRVELNAQPIPQLDITIKGSLFRIAQEFIQNSIKHSGCKNIHIDLKKTANNICLTLKDDGMGFDTTALKHKGIGLDNMRSRTLKLGGTFTLNSSENEGTKLELSLPLKNHHNEK